VNIEEPENWGAQQRGAGYDLRGATAVVFEVRSPTPGGVRIQFGVGGGVSQFMFIPQSQSFSTITIPLASLQPAPSLNNVHILFSVATNVANAPNGGVVLLDNIRFTPVPVSQQNQLGLPLSTQTFGVVPRQTIAPGRVPIPPDQLNRNIASSYEAVLVQLALIERGTTEDLANAQAIAEAFHYALTHDNRGLPLPVAADGSTALHNALYGGALALRNEQGANAGRSGDVRLAGFSAQLCGDTGFCLVLDGATGGNNAFAMLGLLAAYKKLNEVKYLDDARTIGRWIVANLTDRSGTGFGGYFLGYPDEGKPKNAATLEKSKSTENNADIFSAFTLLAAIEKERGNNTASDEWTNRANVAGDFVMSMYDKAAGRFFAGTVPFGSPASAGVTPDGERKGDEIINTFDFLDANTFTLLALAEAPRYRDIDWRRPIQHFLNQAVTVTAGGRTYRGFSIVPQPTAGPQGVAWEFTGQAVVAMRLADCLYQETRFKAAADGFVEQIMTAQASAPFGDGQGVVASALQDGDRLPPLEQCLSTPFQCIPQRVGLAATTWAIFAQRNLNPLSPSGILRICAPMIIAVTRQGKKLLVTGKNFDAGAAILINGEKQKSANDEQNPTTVLIGKKSGKKIRPGDKIQVRNADGTLSPEFIYTG